MYYVLMMVQDAQCNGMSQRCADRIGFPILGSSSKPLAGFVAVVALVNIGQRIYVKYYLHLFKNS